MGSSPHPPGAPPALVPRARRRWARRFGWALVLLFTFAFGMGLVGRWLLEEPDDQLPEHSAAFTEEVSVYVLTESWHSAIVVPQPPGGSLGPPDDLRAAWLEYGWGDRDFWGTRSPGPLMTVAACVLATPSVLRIVGHAEPPTPSATRRVFRRSFTREEAQAILAALESPLARTAEGEREPALDALDWMPGRFFPSRRRYLWWDNCNVFTLRALAQADETISSLAIVHAAQVPARLVGFEELKAP